MNSLDKWHRFLNPPPPPRTPEQRFRDEVEDGLHRLMRQLQRENVDRRLVVLFISPRAWDALCSWEGAYVPHAAPLPPGYPMYFGLYRVTVDPSLVDAEVDWSRL